MSDELQGGETFTDVSPGKTVTSTRLNNHVAGGKLLLGAIANKTELAANGVAAGDFAIVQDVSDGVAAEPKKVQLQNLMPETMRQGVQQYAAGAQSGAVYAVTLSPAATGYTTGMVVRFKADSANAGAVAVNLNGLGNKNLYTRAGAALAANDILTNQIVEAVYDGTQFLVTQALSAAEVTATHLIEAARQSLHQYAVDTGAVNAYVVTLSPAAAAYTTGMVVRFKTANANTGASTVNVNGLGAKNIFKASAVALLANDIVAGQMVTLVYDGTQFQLASPRSADFVSSNNAFPGTSAVLTVAHGLAVRPSQLRAVAVQTNASAQQGFAQNDELDLSCVAVNSTSANAFSVSCDATNIYVSQDSNGTLSIVPRAGGARSSITNANWNIKLYARI